MVITVRAGASQARNAELEWRLAQAEDKLRTSQTLAQQVRNNSDDTIQLLFFVFFKEDILVFDNLIGFA